VLSVRPLVFIGKASYCLYLLHFSLWHIVHESGILGRLGLSRFDPWLSYVLMVALAMAAEHLIEKPAQKVLRNWLKVWR
jgi:peptidoglycan/LPS O-acetylase OafA/YrhL